MGLERSAWVQPTEEALRGREVRGGRWKDRWVFPWGSGVGSLHRMYSRGMSAFRRKRGSKVTSSSDAR